MPMIENTVQTAKQAVNANVLIPRAARAPGAEGMEASVTAIPELDAERGVAWSLYCCTPA